MTVITYLRGTSRGTLVVPTTDLRRELQALGTSVVILSSVPVRA